jgi:adenine phosphoribosyltransferase
VAGFAFVVELDFLGGRARLLEGTKEAGVYSIVKFGAGE